MAEDCRPTFNNLKKMAARAYIRSLERVDPRFAEHVLNAQREFFLAGSAFWRAEAEHAERAIEKIRSRKSD